MAEKSKSGMLRSIKVDVREDSKFVDGKRHSLAVYIGGGAESKYADAFAESLRTLADTVTAHKNDPNGVKLTFHYGTKEFANGRRGLTGYFFVDSVGEAGATQKVTVLESTSDKIAKLKSK